MLTYWTTIRYLMLFNGIVGRCHALPCRKIPSARISWIALWWTITLPYVDRQEHDKICQRRNMECTDCDLAWHEQDRWLITPDKTWQGHYKTWRPWHISDVMQNQVFIHCHAKRRQGWHQPSQAYFWYNIDYELYFIRTTEYNSIVSVLLLVWQHGRWQRC